jgi:hypothetical protein
VVQFDLDVSGYGSSIHPGPSPVAHLWNRIYLIERIEKTAKMVEKNLFEWIGKEGRR